jgi:eukaryotic-like serine/threonine-protein kinase
VATRAADVIQTGRILDGFRLDCLVAVGGTASIFRATEVRSGCAVAIKIFHSQESGRMDPEFEILRRIAHPGIPGVMAKGDRGSRFIAMEWAEGRSLREIVDTGNDLSIERSVILAHKICDVLAHVHEQGIAHLDLKPEHIVVDRDDNIKIIDFGAARSSRSLFSLLGAPRRTGTPDYASPEQIKGRLAGLRSDVYSMGLMFYEMLTGDLPFSGVAADLALNLRLHRDPIPPRELDCEIPAQLENIVTRAIDRDPAKRHANARELCLQLDQFLQAYPEELVGLLN